jgi:hypothetical protein
MQKSSRPTSVFNSAEGDDETLQSMRQSLRPPTLFTSVDQDDDDPEYVDGVTTKK